MRSMTQPLPSTGPSRAVAAVALAAAVLLTAPASLHAQNVYPPNEPRVIVDEDVSSASPPALPAGVTQYDWARATAPEMVSSNDAVSCGSGFWGTHLAQNRGFAGPTAVGPRADVLSSGGTSSVFALTDSVTGNAGYLASDWENFRFEFDFTGDANSAPGVVWAATDVDGDLLIDHGYLFYFDELPTQAEAVGDGDRARWHMVRRLAQYDLELASGEVELNPGNNSLLSIFNDGCYRLRLEFFCGGLRIQVARINCSATDCTATQCDGSNVTCTDWTACTLDWCTVYEWLDTDFNSAFPQPQGFVGAFAGGIDRTTPAVSRFDNLLARTWDYTCSDWCDAWSGWTEDWDLVASNEGREELDLKFLYEGAILDYAYGGIWNVPPPPVYQRIDIAVDLDTASPSRDACSGWTVLHGGDPLLPIVDLPDWASGDSNLDELLTYLEPMASSVKLVNDGGTLSFVDDFDNRVEVSGVANPDFNPNPLPTWGSTPINNALMEAYNWYEAIRTDDGRWANDPLTECRLWYVIFITDGEERCPSSIPDAACVGDGTNPGAAEMFADPNGTLDPAPVYTVGFSQSVPANSPLRCIADITGGNFYSATDAGELVNVLYDVVNEMQESDRQFIPFIVSPPPAAGGQPSEEEDFLTVFPNFVPRNNKTVWDGDLLAFAFSRDQPTLPVTEECTVDTDQMVWSLSGSPAGAAEILNDQVLHSTRYVFIGSDLTGSWVRHAITDVFTNATLLSDFKTKISEPLASVASDVKAVEVVNFVRNLYANPAALSLPSAPVNPPRPDVPPSYPTLGDIYHSQPRVVNPPNNYMYFSDFGLGPAHDYLSYREQQAKRRRVVLAGANDGQLHAFDGGFYDRDDGGTYDDMHDLGTGVELFSWVPEAVYNKLYWMTNGTEHQYMVDGQISVGDVYIDSVGTSDREWRTVALATMRRGGRGVVALDITTPDPIEASNDWVPPVSVFPGCLDGTATGCDAEYPKVLWEFKDLDSGTGLPADADGIGGWDLGWTWSQPAIARIGVYAVDGTGNVRPDDTYVAFFGGGWDRDEADLTGRYFYGVDIETGATVLKELIGVAVPGTPALLDSDNDGFHDKIYFGDTNGAVWRLQYPSPFLSTATGADAGTLRRIFDVSGTLTTASGRQQFFQEPALVPVLFNGVNYTYAIALGSGDRANLGEDISTTVNHFFVVLDDLDNDPANAAYTEANLVAREYGDLVNAFTPDPGATLCTDSAFEAPTKGWYLTLRNGQAESPPSQGGSEKVNYKATIFASHVYFTTFEPTDNSADNPPEICVPTTPSATPTPVATATPTGGGGGGGGGGGTPTVDVCRASGIGRMYDLGLSCGLGEYTEVNDVLTGITTWTIGNTTYVQGTTSGGGSTSGITGGLGPRKEHAINIISSTTNWRQE